MTHNALYMDEMYMVFWRCIEILFTDQKAFLLSYIRIQLMLSHPSCYLVGSLAKKLSNISYSTCYGPLPDNLSFRIKVINSWLFF